MKYFEILESHEGYSQRKKYSEEFIEKIKKYIEVSEIFKNRDITLFVAGSLGRMEFGKNSDVDFFVISKRKISHLLEIEILGYLIHLNHKLKLPEFSNDGKFLKVYSLEEMISKTGSPVDDHENHFTTRLLMILESKAIVNEELYFHALKEVIDNYFKDKNDHPDFFPIYLLNDIARYWRTLCLNYEVIRFDKNKLWRKKNINLKYSRMITIFATILPLLTLSNIREADVMQLTKLSPHERLAFGLDKMNNNNYLTEYKVILDLYEGFLKAKENNDIDKNKDIKEKLDKQADDFSDFLYKILMDRQHNPKFKKYLVI